MKHDSVDLKLIKQSEKIDHKLEGMIGDRVKIRGLQEEIGVTEANNLNLEDLKGFLYTEISERTLKNEETKEREDDLTARLQRRDQEE